MIIKKKIFENLDITELVNADGGIISGDRNIVSNSEIETGPVDKSFNDNSDFEKGISTTHTSSISSGTIQLNSF